MKYNARWNIEMIALFAFVLCALMFAGFVWFAVALVVVIIGVGIPHSYELGETHLVVFSGLLQRRFPYSQMVQLERISPVANEGPDASICIRLQSGRKLRLTPREAARLVQDLQERAPHLATLRAAGS